MDWPRPDSLLALAPAAPGPVDVHKFRYGQRLAAALGYIGLTGGDRVSVGLLAGERLADRRGPGAHPRTGAARRLAPKRRRQVGQAT